MADDFELAREAYERGDFEAAARGYRACSQYVNAAYNLGAVYRQLGRLHEAERVFRDILRQRPNFVPSALSLAYLLLSQGRYAEGWKWYESRRGYYTDIVEPVTSVLEWRGESPRGRRLAVCAEQGFGDQIMFARFLPFLQELGAEVLVGCGAPMRRAFERAGYETFPYSRDQRTLPDADLWTLLCSLPLRLGVSNVPPPMAFGFAPANGLGLGVCPQGDPTHRGDAHRSMPEPWNSRLLSMGRDLRPEATGATDFLDTFELVSRLEAVASVDTSVAHAAATIGVRTLVLLPFLNPDWRWGYGDGPSPWYPTTEMVRQPAMGDWGSVLAALPRCLHLS